MLVSAKMHRIWWKTRKNMLIGELKRVVKSIFRGGKEAFQRKYVVQHVVEKPIKQGGCKIFVKKY